VIADLAWARARVARAVTSKPVVMRTYWSMNASAPWLMWEMEEITIAPVSLKFEVTFS
jgi:hypothetical protein